MTNIEKRIRELGLALPECPTPLAAYQPTIKAGSMVFVSGNLPMVDGKVLYTGQLGRDRTVEEGYEAARICLMRCLGALSTVADLDRVRIVSLGGYVSAAEGFTEHPQVINGASELAVQIFGDKGKHARKAIGCSSLPAGACVEVELTAMIEE